jgi:hypothetical protein
MFVAGFFFADVSQFIHDRYISEMRNVDLVGTFINKTNKFNDRYLEAHDKLLRDHISKEGMNILGWLAIGQRFAEANLPEFAYHSFYMAHLLNHKLIKTNSELKFDTSLPPNTPRESAGNIDELLNTLLTDRE